MRQHNLELRATLQAHKIPHWALAQYAGISATTLCVWLRQPLSGERKERVEAALEACIKDCYETDGD